MSTATKKPATAKKPAANKAAKKDDKKNVNTKTEGAPAQGASGATTVTGQVQTPPAPTANDKPLAASKPGKVEVVKLADIKASSKTQVRVKLNDEALENYTEAAKGWKDKGADSEFPPLIVFREVVKKEGKEDVINLWLGDGFTRRAALKTAGFAEHACEIREGNMQDAFLFGCQINATHGATLNNKDKKNALTIALDDKELVLMSNNALAQTLGFSESFVRNNRPKNKLPEFVLVANKGGAGTRKVSTKKGGAKKGAAAGKKGAATASAGAASGGGDVTNAPGGGGTPGESSNAGAGAPATGTPANADQQQAAAGQRDDETDRKLNKIADFLNEARPGWGNSVRDAINNGALPMSPRDIRFWSETSKDRVQRAAPLIVENKWMVKQAFAFLDKVPDATTKFDYFVNLAVVGNGIASEVIDGYRVIVIAEDKFDVTRNIPNRTYLVAPKGSGEQLPDTAPAAPEKPEAERTVELDADQQNGGGSGEQPPEDIA